MDLDSYIREESWIGLEVHCKDTSSVLLSSGRINCSRTDAHFQDGILDEVYVDVTVLEVFVGNEDDIMTHARWSVSECWFSSG